MKYYITFAYQTVGMSEIKEQNLKVAFTLFLKNMYKFVYMYDHKSKIGNIKRAFNHFLQSEENIAIEFIYENLFQKSYVASKGLQILSINIFTSQNILNGWYVNLFILKFQLQMN